MSRKFTTGKFETREELEQFISDEWYFSKRTQEQIARASGVSGPTVNNILKKIRGPSHPTFGRTKLNPMTINH